MRILKLGLAAFLFLLSCLPVASATEEVTIPTPDGIKLAGTLDLVPGNKGTVILIHMLNHSRKDWGDFAKFLNANGWSTLSFDLRGHGESRGPDNTVDWKDFSRDDFRKMIQDITAAVQLLKARENPEIKNVFLVGASIGANLSVEFASRHPEVTGVVLLSPGVDYRGLKPKRAVVELNDRAILFVASEEDTFSMNSSDFLYQLAPSSKKQFIKLNAGGHGTDMLEADSGLKDQILGFLTRSVS